MLAQLLVGILFFLFGSYLLETPLYNGEVRFWLALFYQGVVIAGFGFLSNAWLIKRYLPSTVTFFSFIQPPTGLALAWVFLDEDPGNGLIVGLVLIVVGAIIFGGESYIKARKTSSLVTV
jgi:drug/metabolite transporter (DMT)-like permease